MTSRLEIEWRRLDIDGKTCDRCSETGVMVRNAYDALVDELRPEGWEVTFKETLLTDRDISESNGIYLNGIAIEDLLPDTRKSENCCASCGELLGKPTMCGTLEVQDQILEAIPADIVLSAARRLIRLHGG